MVIRPVSSQCKSDVIVQWAEFSDVTGGTFVNYGFLRVPGVTEPVLNV